MKTIARAAILAAARASARSHRRATVKIGEGAMFFGRPLIAAVPGALIDIGPNVRLVSRSRDTPLGVNHRVVIRALRPGATITIGADSGLSGGVVCAAVSVSIGAGCLLGANVTVLDTDFHPLNSLSRASDPLPEPRATDRVQIGDNVFLGTGAIVLKGVSIGRNSVIGAGSVVTSDCEPNTIVAGNPAQPIGEVRLPVRG